jgi:hypothetical protein
MQSLEPSKGGRVNVRVFLLIAVTVLLGSIWSSDRRYQEEHSVGARQTRMTGFDGELPYLQAAADAPLGKLIPFVAATAVGQPQIRELAACARLGWNQRSKIARISNWAERQRWGLAAARRAGRWRGQSIYFPHRPIEVVVRRKKSWQNIALEIVRNMLRQIEAASRTAAAAGKFERR